MKNKNDIIQNVSGQLLGTIQRYSLLDKCDNVIVALSGGADSVCLLHLLSKISKEYDFKLGLTAVHLNHMLRGNEAISDARYCYQLCKSLGIKFYYFERDIGILSEDMRISFEEAGRKERYELLEKVRKQIYGLKEERTVIATGHNKNDRVETIMMNIIRGCGIDGLKGISYKNGFIIRPLLDVYKHEINQYCARNMLFPKNDKTNVSSLYTRNRVRMELLPFIKEKFNPEFEKVLLRLSDSAISDNDYIEKSALDFIEKTMVDSDEKSALDLIPLKAFNNLHEAVAVRVVRYSIQKVKGNISNIGDIHIKDVINLAKAGSTGSIIHLPALLRVEKSYNSLFFYMENSNSCIAESPRIQSNNYNICNKYNGMCNELILLDKAFDNTTDSDINRTTDSTTISTANRTTIRTTDSTTDSTLLDIPGRIELNSNNGKIIIECSVLDMVDYIKNNHYLKSDDKNSKYKYTKYFDYDMIKKGIKIRKRISGDFFYPIGMKGSKKLKEYFIDEKIPVWIRDRIPVLTVDGSIVWVAGFRQSEKHKVTGNTKKVAKIQLFVERVEQ